MKNSFWDKLCPEPCWWYDMVRPYISICHIWSYIYIYYIYCIILYIYTTWETFQWYYLSDLSCLGAENVDRTVIGPQFRTSAGLGRAAEAVGTGADFMGFHSAKKKHEETKSKNTWWFCFIWQICQNPIMSVYENWTCSLVFASKENRLQMAVAFECPSRRYFLIVSYITLSPIRGTQDWTRLK